MRESIACRLISVWSFWSNDPPQALVWVWWAHLASNSAKVALGAALAAAQETPAAPVPMHIRNAPTGLMKELGYGEGIGTPTIRRTHTCRRNTCPDELRGTAFYEPGPFGYERRWRSGWTGGSGRRGRGGRRGEDSGRATRPRPEDPSLRSGCTVCICRPTICPAAGPRMLPMGRRDAPGRTVIFSTGGPG